MKNVEISRPRFEDIELINEFFVTVLRHTFERNGIGDLVETIDGEIIDKRKKLNEDFECNGEFRYFLIAKDGEKVVGSIEYGPSSELINSCTNGAVKEVVEIGTGFVHPDYQQQGLGNRLLNELFIELQKRGIEEFCFDSGYKSAQELWVKKFGKPQYHLKDYWGEDADHMAWHLKVKDFLK